MLTQALRDIHRCERLAWQRLQTPDSTVNAALLLREMVCLRISEDLTIFEALGLAAMPRVANVSFPAGCTHMVLDLIVYHTDYEVSLFQICFSQNITRFGLIKAAAESTFLKHNNITVREHIAIILTAYVRKKTLLLAQQFSAKSISSDVKAVAAVPEKVVRWLRNPKEQKAELAPKCFLPAPCTFQKSCFEKTQQGSIFELNGWPELEKKRYFFQGKTQLRDLNPSGLSAKQQRQIAWQQDDYYVAEMPLRHYLAQLKPPFVFLDFEAVQSPIALYKNTKAFQLTPFLFSTHILHSPHSLEVVTHKTHIAAPSKDPHYDFARTLLKILPKTGSILVYDPGYEKLAITHLAARFPALRTRLLELTTRMVDLSLPFREQWLYHKNMQGKSAFKYILPAMIPTLGYSDLYIDNGEQAACMYALLVNHRQHHGMPHPQESEHLAELVRYCSRDTWGLYRVFCAIKALLAQQISPVGQETSPKQ